MSENSAPRIINPPNRLREKVSGSGPISDEMVERAELALREMTAQFDSLMAAEIEKLTVLYETGVRDPDSRMDVARDIFEIAHDLRGQAGTFDYPLITRVGSSLCHFTDGLTECDERHMEVIRIHIDAMQAVLASELRGDGGAMGREIAGGLEKAVEKVLS